MSSIHGAHNLPPSFSTLHQLQPRKGCSDPVEGFTDPDGNALMVTACRHWDIDQSIKQLTACNITQGPLVTPHPNVKFVAWPDATLYMAHANGINAQTGACMQNYSSAANHAADVSNAHAMSIAWPISGSITGVIVALWVGFKVAGCVSRSRARQRARDISNENVWLRPIFNNRASAANV